MASLLDSYTTDPFLHESFCSWVFISWFCLISYLQADWWWKGKMCFDSCFFSFLFFPWIWGISFLTFVRTKHDYEILAWYFTISELLNDRDGVLISEFHTAVSGESKGRDPQALTSQMTHWQRFSDKIFLQLCTDKLFFSPPSLRAMNFLLLWIKAILIDLYSVNIYEACTLCQAFSHNLSHLI